MKVPFIPKNIYKPLPKGFIRLLSVNPSPENAGPQPIICSLNQEDLMQKPTYNCLSYTWGSPFSSIGYPPAQTTLPRHVICDGARIQVTENLFVALTTLRSQTPEQLRSIWIDAICINQEDLLERSDQVARMGSIYSSAVSVIVWLGPADDFTQEALDTISLIKSQGGSQGGGELLKNLHKILDEFIDPNPKAQSLLKKVSAEQWLQSTQLFRRSWFSRVWIIQEIVLAKNIQVYCGKCELLWDDLNLLSVSTKLVGDRVLDESIENPFLPDLDLKIAIRRDIMSRTDNVLTLSLLRDSWSRKCGFVRKDIERHVLSTIRGRFSCTDSRDYVYGLYGLLNDDENLPLSYAKSVEEVFADFISSSIQRDQHINILSRLEDATLRKLKSLPSWVPDLSSTRTVFLLSGDIVSKPLVHWYQQLKHSDHPTTRDGILSITALCLGSIDKLAWVSEDAIVSMTKTSGVLKFLRFLDDLPDLFRDGQERIFVFKEVLKTGSIMEKKRLDSLDTVIAVIAARALIDTKRDIEESVLEQLVKSLHDSDTAGLTPSWEQVDELRHSYLDIRERELCDEEFITVTKRHPMGSGDYELLPGGKNIFYTSTGQMGIGYLSSQEGDQLWASLSSQNLLILRPLQSGNYQFVGQAYLHGTMGSEVDGSEERMQRIRIE